MSAYHTRVGIIKGWLMAKEAPVTILRILDELSEEPPSPVSLLNSVEEVTRQREARRNAEAGASPAVTEGARKIVSDLAASAKQTAIALGQPFEKFKTDADSEVENSMISEKKKYKKLSPEEKHAIITRYPIREGFPAGESTKALSIEFDTSQATVIATLHKAGVAMRPSAAMVNKAKAAGNWPRPQDEDTDTPTPATTLPPRRDTPPDKLIHEHTEYVGARTDGLLVDHDWGDIKKMRNNGAPLERIAKSYGVEQDYLIRFVELQDAKEESRAKTKNF